jgi:hypothetical protein
MREEQEVQSNIEASSPNHSNYPSQNEVQPGVFARTLGIASTAAGFVFYPYIVAGKVVYHTTTYAIHAPINISRHLTHSISSTWQGMREEEKYEVQLPKANHTIDSIHDNCTVDTKNEIEEENSTKTKSTRSYDLFGDSQDIIASTITEENTDLDVTAQEPMISLPESEIISQTSSESNMSRFLLSPVRLVSSGVSTVASMPTAVISFTGNKISDIVYTSQQVATTAITTSGKTVARTSFRVARGVSYGVFSTATYTATKAVGAVGSSVRGASSMIPESVSNKVWQGVELTGSTSTSIVSYAIAVPAYRILVTLFPGLAEHFTEKQCVTQTRSLVLTLISVFGPQNAFYILKYIYETLNSEEAYDMLMLCRDITGETLNGENYRRAGYTIGDKTGINTVTPILKEVYQILPSFEEVKDFFTLLGDVSEEFIDRLQQSSQQRTQKNNLYADEDRFEYLDEKEETEETSCSTDDEEYLEETDERSRTTSFGISFDFFKSDEEIKQEEFIEEAVHTGCIEESLVFEGSNYDSEGEEKQEEEYYYGDEHETSNYQTSLFDMGVSLFTDICDSEETVSLINSLGNMLDSLVEQ